VADAELARRVDEVSGILDRAIVPREHEDEIHCVGSRRAQMPIRA
jgi:hypothetical protein